MSPRERPLLMRGELVRAVLAGRKTQTRRLVKPQPPGWVDPTIVNRTEVQHLFQWTEPEQSPPRKLRRWPEEHYMRSPFSFPVTRLWVRETWSPVTCEKGDPGAWWGPDRNLFNEDNGPDDQWMQTAYAADATYGPGQYGMAKLPGGGMFEGPWRPSIHMPRWACRLVLAIVDVRVQRLQDISEEDARAEGMEDDEFRTVIPVDGKPKGATKPYHLPPSRRAAFANLWDRLYREQDAGWDVNPWVWCVSFKRVEEASRAA